MKDTCFDEGPRIFKGKQISTGKWIRGFYHQFLGESSLISVINCCQQDHIVYPDSVCAATGLIDKDGELIFENDICEFQILDETPVLVHVCYMYGAFGFHPIHPEDVCEEDREWSPFMRYTDDPWDTNYFKVIGNYFDFEDANK